MFLKRFLQIGLLVPGIINCTDFAAAQIGNARPASEVGGYASSQLRSIYRSGVGRNFSADAINSQSLSRATARIGNVGQATARSPRIDAGLGGNFGGNKPFSDYSPAPTVSPYMNLFREDNNGIDDFNYQTLVRPQLQQQQFNQQQQRANFDIARRLQSMAAQADYNPQGSTSQIPTGHQTVFMYHGHYYPAQGRRR